MLIPIPLALALATSADTPSCRLAALEELVAAERAFARRALESGVRDAFLADPLPEPAPAGP